MHEYVSKTCGAQVNLLTSSGDAREWAYLGSVIFLYTLSGAHMHTRQLRVALAMAWLGPGYASVRLQWVLPSFPI